MGFFDHEKKNPRGAPTVSYYGQTAGAGGDVLGGILGGILGLFGGPIGAAVGAGIGKGVDAMHASTTIDNMKAMAADPNTDKRSLRLGSGSGAGAVPGAEAFTTVAGRAIGGLSPEKMYAEQETRDALSKSFGADFWNRWQ